MWMDMNKSGIAQLHWCWIFLSCCFNELVKYDVKYAGTDPSAGFQGFNKRNKQDKDEIQNQG